MDPRKPPPTLNRLATTSREKTVCTLFASIKDLTTFPHRGRPGREGGTRELVLTPLPISAVYSLQSDVVQILHIWHGAQDWP